jgi:Tfp pilus assembly protein PilO
MAQTDNKNNLLNIVVIIIALIVSFNIYKAQDAKRNEVLKQKEIELQKNGVLGEIQQSEIKMTALKNIINNKNLSEVMNKLGDLARASAVNILSVRPQPEEDLPGYTKHTFELTVSSANYHNIGKFVNDVERDGDIFIMDNFSVLPSQAGEGPGSKLKAEIKLSTIMLKD